MKAIVVRQPWATLISLGIKTIETRPSPPNGPMRPEGVRGLPGCSLERGERIAIVAGAARTKADIFEHVEAYRPLLDPVLGDRLAPGISFSFSAVVCTVTVDDALPIVDSWDESPGVWPPEHPSIVPSGRYDDLSAVLIAPGNYQPTSVASGQLPLGDFTPGRWGWLLSDPQPCDPIPCKGKQGVFVLPDDVAGLIPKAGGE